MEFNINRRHFIGGAGLLAASSLIGTLAGCSSEGNDAPQNTATAENASAPLTVDEELTCDLVVVGAGASGLAACVEAGNQGKDTICLESQSMTGGNIVGVEGCFGIGSKMQNDEGIEVETGLLIRQELEQGQYRVNGLTYVDMVHQSGDNIDWLIEQGVLFGGVDADLGIEKVFHRFGTGNGRESYVPQMTAAAENGGVRFLLNTKGDSLIQDETGSIIGVYATQDGKKKLKINTRAVVIATGCYMNNEEYMLELGLKPGNYEYVGLPGHDGTGHDMAIACGAKSNKAASSPLGALKVSGLPSKFEDGKFFYIGFSTPYSVWVNESGERFVNEDCAANNFCLMQMPCLDNKNTYIVLDHSMMEQFIVGNESANIDAAKAAESDGSLSGDEAARIELEDGISKGVIFKADTVSELAAQAGMDPMTLENTLKRYNDSAQKGFDQDFGKNAELLIPFQEGPYYAVEVVNEILCVTGSVKTNRDFSAVNSYGEAIKGLYVVGVEGASIWANVYTINISGACNANSVHSGRTAVQHAIETCL